MKHKTEFAYRISMLTGKNITKVTVYKMTTQSRSDTIDTNKLYFKFGAFQSQVKRNIHVVTKVKQ